MGGGGGAAAASVVSTLSSSVDRGYPRLGSHEAMSWEFCCDRHGREEGDRSSSVDPRLGNEKLSVAVVGKGLGEGGGGGSRQQHQQTQRCHPVLTGGTHG